MPGRRPVKKGSFGSHFDELMKHFTSEQPARSAKPTETKPDPRNVHDRLLERAGRDARDRHDHRG
jgi:hypothetical protein